MKLRIGFSTGALYRMRLSFPEKIKLIKSIGCNAIELGFLKPEELNPENIQTITPDTLKGFEYISLHAPKFNYGYNPGTREIFEKISVLNKFIGLGAVVFHPNRISDLTAFNGVSFRAAFENMDSTNTCYQKPEDLEPLFLPDQRHRLVLDVNHTFSCDQTAELTRQFFRRLGQKITHVHLSGYNNKYSGGHGPLFETGQVEILRSIEDLGLPIIIESVVFAKTIRKELNYILRTIN